MDLAHQPQVEQTVSVQRTSANKVKFLIGGLLIIAAVVYLIISSATANAQYFMTVEEIQQRGSAVLGRELRVSGAVIGDSIQYDPQTLRLEFIVAHTPGSQKEIDAQGGMAAVLHAAVMDPNRPRLKVVYNGVKPDLLRNEAQAIMTGRLGEDGVFYAEELLLKCPTRYEEALPEQVENSDNGN
ncbi:MULTISPECIES: cytochrome c maturation protein CcmE [Anaerolinea]|jgi:cytochrome c-type biogenesis protein CcmE|uniref:cytochrome c maturation protein CcmE n=1 Tax=Anaerolinea TaxID=233189 RepID=UPI0026021DA2|nr:cytochrome c maturation protein CcmE [Anaerolinea thermophila]